MKDGLLACHLPLPNLPENEFSGIPGFVRLTVAGPHRIFTGLPVSSCLSTYSFITRHNTGKAVFLSIKETQILKMDKITESHYI